MLHLTCRPYPVPPAEPPSLRVGRTPPVFFETASTLIHQLADPISIAGMAAGGALFQTARLGVRTWLLSRGVRAQVLAFGAGMAAEVPGMVLCSRGLHLAFRNGAESPTTLDQEMTAMALAMGPLRVLGAGGAWLARQSGNATGPLHHLLAQGGIFAGIMAGQWGERRWLHHSSVDFVTALGDGLKFYGQFHLGGYFLPRPFEKFFHRWERSTLLREKTPPSSFSNQGGPIQMGQLAPAGPILPSGPTPVRLKSFKPTSLQDRPYVAMVGQTRGQETALERKLRKGLVIPPSELGRVVQQLIDEIPPGPSLLPLEDVESPTLLLLKGKLRHRRLEALHRLLTGGKDPKALRAIDNGPGSVPDTAFSLARLGTSVTIKEPVGEELSFLQYLFKMEASRKIQRRIRYTPPREIDIPTPAEVVYWTNVPLHNLQLPGKVRLENYLGRDVKPGGYLVLQTDHALGYNQRMLELPFDPNGWERIYNARLPSLYRRSNYILPTVQSQNLHLQIYRRKPLSPEAGG